MSNEQLLFATAFLVLAVIASGWLISRRLAQLPDERARMLAEITNLKVALADVKERLAVETSRLNNTIDFLLAQNQGQAATINRITDENETLARDNARLRSDLADANALLRNLQPRT